MSLSNLRDLLLRRLAIFFLACFGLCGSLSSLRASEGGPLSILFLDSGKWSQGGLDPKFSEKLRLAGIEFVQANYNAPLSEDFLRRFDVFVLGEIPIDNAENNTFGLEVLSYRSNIGRIVKAVENGAGLLVHVDLSGEGAWRVQGWNSEMEPFGIAVRQACMIDPNHASFTSQDGRAWYSWTENLPKHAVTEGVRRIYYPNLNMRWDDSYTAAPLILEKAWEPLVRAMPGARCAYEEDGTWIDTALPPGGLIWAAARKYQKGRMAVVSIPSIYSHNGGFRKLDSSLPLAVGEMTVGPLDGDILENGDGSVPSDTFRFLLNLYRWLGEDSKLSKDARYRQGQPLERDPAVLEEIPELPLAPVDWSNPRPLNSWAQVSVKGIGIVNDPRVKGPIKFFKALVGARTSLSDGKGTVSEYAESAKDAGYSMVAFTDSFENLTEQKWDVLVKECHQKSSDEIRLLPGFEIEDAAGIRYVVVNPGIYPRPSWLTSDGKRLLKTQMISPLVIGNCLVAAYPGRDSGIPTERLKFFSGLPIAIYRGDRQVFDGRDAYAWHAANADMPIPVVLHEVFSPGEVAEAASSGLQQLLPADSLREGVNYFRGGMNLFFDHPSRHLISGGPVVEQFVCWAEGAPPDGRGQYRVWLKVASKDVLDEVLLYDGLSAVRRWKPSGKVFEATADFRQSQQRNLYVVARDQKGEEAFTSVCRMGTTRPLFRCQDRQNWLGDVPVIYPGTAMPDGTDIVMRIKGIEEGNGLFPDTPGACMATKLQYPFVSNEVVLSEVVLDEKYKSACYNEIGKDARPAFPSEKSTVYEGKVRRWSFSGNTPDAPYPGVLEYDLRLKKTVQPQDPSGLFPSFSALRGKQLVFEFDKENVAKEMLDAGQTSCHGLMPGEMAGGFIPLTEGFGVFKGNLGLKPLSPDAVELPAGTRFQARMLFSGRHSGWETSLADNSIDDNPVLWMRSAGFGLPTPYEIVLHRGKLEKMAFLAEIVPDKGIVEGEVKMPAKIPYPLPLQISGLNPRWPSGIWRPELGIRDVGVFEGKSWPLLDASKTGRFLAGNLITSDQASIGITVVQWTGTSVRLDVHNPNDLPLEASLQTPVEIPGFFSFCTKVKIPAGHSVLVALKNSF